MICITSGSDEFLNARTPKVGYAEAFFSVPVESRRLFVVIFPGSFDEKRAAMQFSSEPELAAAVSFLWHLIADAAR